MNYIVSVYFQDGIEEIFLPNVDNTVVNYTILPQISSYRYNLELVFEVWNSEWCLRSTDSVELYVEARRMEMAPVREDVVIMGSVKGSKDRFSIIVHENFDSYTAFNKYIFNSNVSVGSSPNNNLQFNVNNLVSGEHAVLINGPGGNCTLKDLNSRNGTFLNGRRIKNQTLLSYGDVIYIVGLKIVYLKDMLAISTPFEDISIRGLQHEAPEPEDAGNSGAIPDATFARPPRHVEKFDIEPVEIENPPSLTKSQKPPLVFTVGPAFTMVIPIAVGLMFMLLMMPQNSGFSNPYIFMGVIISATAAVIGAFWAIVNFLYARQTEKHNVTQRKEQYTAYINMISDELKAKGEQNRLSLLRCYPPTSQCANWLVSSPGRIWERSPRHDDFLALRIGYSDIPFMNEIRTPKQSLSQMVDELGGMPGRIKSDYSIIKNAPVLIELRKHSIVGIPAYDRNRALEIAMMLSVQVALTHAYTETRMAFIYNSNEKSWFAHARWLPHVWSESGDLRLLANDKNTANEVFYFLSEQAKSRLSDSEPGVAARSEPPLPYYVIFISSLELASEEPAYKALLSAVSGGKNVGMALIFITDRIGRLPAECTTIIEEQDAYLRLFSLDNDFASVEKITCDRIDIRAAAEISRKLSGYTLSGTDQRSGLPKIVTYLNLLESPGTDSLDITHRWLRNRSYQSMRAPVGVTGAGKTFYLDIHEKYHGPHGLIAGTTGSGKSEFLQTYILSMALNYHPHEVAFLLIDYKGGDMARFFADLPHTSGVITNLDGNGITRALASIKAEIASRQRIFSQFQVRHIDEYIELFRLSKVTWPLPHLIIIADEFAELKKDNAEFIRELVSASRVGRSLGIHLILATQQPSAAVDGEIRANSKFGVCLRVNDKYESISMVGRADAAYIQPAQTGRGFFQVGNDDIFEEFQAAWSGARYEPDKRIGRDNGKAATMISIQGKPEVIWSGGDEADDRDAQTQIAAIVEAIKHTAAINHIEKVRRTWLAPLPKYISLDMINKGIASGANAPDSFPVVVGLGDEPALQRQSPVTPDIFQTGHILICGGSMSGKTTLIETILVSAANTLPPGRLNIYIADYTSRLLSVFSKMPHVGGIVLPEEADKAEKLMKLLRTCLNERKYLFSEKGIGAFRDYIRVGCDLPAILLVIDGLPEFIEANIKLEEDIMTLAKEGPSLGVYIIASCGGIGEVRGRLKNYFMFNIGLGLADKFDYTQTLGERCEITAEKGIPGRGMIRSPEPVEFQAATPVSASPEDLRAALSGEISKLTAMYGTPGVRPIPSIPEKPDYDRMMSEPSCADMLSKGLIPLGYDLNEAEIVPVDLEQTYCYTIVGQQRTGKTNALKLLLKLAKQTGAKVYLFDNEPSPLASFAETIGITRFIKNTDELYQFSKEILIPEFTARGSKTQPPRANEPIYVFMHNILRFCDAIYSDDYPMGSFFESIFSTGSHLNIRFIAASPLIGINERMSLNALRNFFSWGTGILLGGKVLEQNIFDFDVPLTESSKKLPAGTGYTFSGGRTVKLKLPLVSNVQ